MDEHDAYLNPHPKVWPACSECDVPYVLRRAIVFLTYRGRSRVVDEWVWQRDCTHRKAEAVTRTEPKRRRKR